MKHKIPQTDGADDKDLEEAKGPAISHIVVLRNWEHSATLVSLPNDCGLFSDLLPAQLQQEGCEL